MKTANLSPEARAALRKINLHFHDLRRECGSRWLEGGVPLHKIRDWLGHSNIAQTSTYLAGTGTDDHSDLARFEAHQARLQKLRSDTNLPSCNLALGAGGRWFESSRPDHFQYEVLRTPVTLPGLASQGPVRSVVIIIILLLFQLLRGHTA